jgi:hypothetical protein
VTYAKMQNVSANSKLLGSSATGSGAAPSEITVGTGLTMTASTLSSTVTGTVTTTGSPASGNLTKFSGTTSITNADLTGDVTTSGTEATTLATVNSNVGTFGDSSHVAQVTANAKGLITAVSNVTLTAGGLGGTTLLDTVGQLDIVNTVVDTTLYTFSVPGNSLGTTHSLHLVINGDILNNSGVARAITMTLIYGTTTLYKATSGTITSVARRACFFEIYLVAAGGTSAQEGTVRWLMPNSTGTGVTTGVGSMQSALLADGYGYGTSAENSTGALSLTFKIQLGAADANFSLRRQSAFLELL